MENTSKKTRFGLIMATYLFGIFMGAIDTGIVTPARTIIQNNLSVDAKTGIWMITIYTLAYAASIPIMGKLADKYGRKYVYLTSIFLFGFGSLFCGLSQSFGSFPLLLAARAVQAIGGGGIVPVATAEFGTTFPKEKRGMALGLVGGVYGIANILGASAGSAILDLFGKNNWQFIFYINIPITLFILIAGYISLPNTKAANVKRIDIWGISTLTVMILSLLYGMKNIDFFHFSDTITSTNVYPFLLIFVVLMPLFIFAEKKAADPVLNLSYFKNLKIVITLLLSFITGIIIMGMIFVPQFSENALKIASGSGGYFVLILGLFSGFAAPMSGRLIDKYGVKPILGLGFLISALGSLFIILVTVNYPSILTVVVGLVMTGLGIGFTMGTPLNYMMLDNTKPEESNSALATLSLIRSIGTAIAPAIMIAFISHAGLGVQTNVQALLPTTVEVPALPYAQELTDQFAVLKADPVFGPQFSQVKIPDLTSGNSIDLTKMNSGTGVALPAELADRMRMSDVTTIVDNSKALSKYMFDASTPKVITGIQSGVQSGITGIGMGITMLGKSIADMQQAANPGTAGAIAGMQATLDNLKDMSGKMTILKDAVPGAFETASANYLAEIDSRRAVIENEFQRTLNGGFSQVYLTTAIVSVLALLIMAFYSSKKKPETVN